MDLHRIIDDLAGLVREPVTAYLRLCTESPIAALAVLASIALSVFIVALLVREDIRSRSNRTRPW